MSAESAAMSHSWRVGKYTVAMTVPKPRPGTVASVCIEWELHVPQRLTPDEIEQYRAGRDATVAALGLTAMVVDL